VRSAFRRETMSTRKTDLVTLLTPTVMTPARVAQATVKVLEKVR
jgi:type II secretory pathway component GspD/PulD (secretin)